MVAGGVIEGPSGVLLVRNQRKNGSHDWSTPGGVVDPGEETVEALSREVAEETGLVVPDWTGPIYRVEVQAPVLDWHLTVEVFSAPEPAGEISVEDPDGIVVEARWFAPDGCAEPLDGNQRWVTEPLVGYLAERWGEPPSFRYLIDRRDGAGLNVVVLED
jgi:8-oxo-dGTP diphosphatase